MRKNEKKLQVIAEIAIFGALAFALDILQGGIFRGIFPNGGSIGLAMIPILIIAYRRGIGSGLICGLLVSLLQMLGGIYAIASNWYLVILQILLDYIIAYPLVGMAGIFSKSYRNSTSNKQKAKFICFGTILGGTLKLLAHYLAGIIFWGYTFPENFVGGPYVYSLVYNGGYMIPNIIIAILILLLINSKNPSLLFPNSNIISDEEVKENE